MITIMMIMIMIMLLLSITGPGEVLMPKVVASPTGPFGRGLNLLRNSTVQLQYSCSAVAVQLQCSCSARQSSAVQCSAVQCSAVQYNIL